MSSLSPFPLPLPSPHPQTSGRPRGRREPTRRGRVPLQLRPSGKHCLLPVADQRGQRPPGPQEEEHLPDVQRKQEEELLLLVAALLRGLAGEQVPRRVPRGTGAGLAPGLLPTGTLPWPPGGLVSSGSREKLRETRTPTFSIHTKTWNPLGCLTSPGMSQSVDL